LKKPRKPHPPRWATCLLEWYCRPEVLEDLQGDLNEYFERNVSAKGGTHARIIYVLDVLKFLRLYTVRKPQFVDLLTHCIMIGSYMKTSSRSILRHRLFSSINIAGLAISMAVGLLMIVFMSELLSYDSFHKKKDRIFRITSKDHNEVELASTSVKAGNEIKAEIPGVEDVTIIRRDFGGDALAGDKILPVSGLWADESFLKIFDFPLLQGDPATALKEPYSIVLTETTAQKLFGEQNALGKAIRFDTTEYMVTGIMKDVPKLSHLRFTSLASFSTVAVMNPETDGGFLDWTSVYMNYVYVLIPEGGSIANLKRNLDKLCARENANQKNGKISLELQPLTQISIGKTLGNQLGPKLPNLAIWILIGLAVVVIISACFNYTNLSIARSLRRSREVGIRKAIGAMKSHIRGQFVSEAVIISFLALTVSFILFLFLRRQFLSLDRFVENLVSLDLSPMIIFYFVAFALIVGVMAGFLPALFFSKVNAIQALKDISSLRVFHNVNTRKAMIVVQYIFSLIFITITIMGYKQYKSFLTFDLGFKTENILNIKLQGNQAELVIKALSECPEVKAISRSLLVMSLGSRYGTQMKYRASDSAQVMMNFVDDAYLPLHEHKFLTGKNFTPKPESAEESEAIVNEQLLRRFDIGDGDPAKALGETILIEGKKLMIVGVVEDFHYETVEEKIEPMVFRYFHYGTNGYVNAKLATKNWPAAMSSIELAWRKIDKVHPLEARFYDDQIQEAYSQFSVMIKVIGFLAFLAISIASMGLFGMVVFTTETRLKEISIRKVLGASEERLVYLLSKGFLFLLSLAASIALPGTYIFFDKVVLSNFVYHEPITIIDTVMGFILIMMIALIMVLSQTLKVARTNPAEVLKNE
jgi:ABC-type antimicrobial peptide transport system permease subunit